MQPDIMETEHTAAMRAVMDEAKAAILQRRAQCDLSTPEGRHHEVGCNAQLAVLPAIAAWMAAERERGTSNEVIFAAGLNVCSNALGSVIGSCVPDPMIPEIIETAVLDVHRYLFRVFSTPRGGDPDRIHQRYTRRSGRA